MTFAAYIDRQKRIIRSRHEGEMFLIEKGETVALSESEKIFKDLSGLKGLNTRERLYMSRAVKPVKSANVVNA